MTLLAQLQPTLSTPFMLRNNVRNGLYQSATMLNINQASDKILANRYEQLHKNLHHSSPNTRCKPGRTKITPIHKHTFQHDIKLLQTALLPWTYLCITSLQTAFLQLIHASQVYKQRSNKETLHTSILSLHTPHPIPFINQTYNTNGKKISLDYLLPSDIKK